MSEITVDKNNLHSYKLKLTTLSPIHIGTGEVYEPTNYVIDNNKFYGFDEVLFYRSLSNGDKKLFDAKLNDYMHIIDFYKEHKEEAKKISNFECKSSHEVQNQYNKKRNKNGKINQNQLEIQTTFKNPNTHRAIIPGSSIKGMLDTVLQIYPKKIKENDIRQNLIVSDALLVSGGVEIGKANRKHKDPRKISKQGIYQFIEVIYPESKFVFTIKSKFNFEDIKKQLKRFHAQRENSRYEETENSFVARIGKNEGKEYVVDDGTNVLNNDKKPVATHFVYISDTLYDEQFGWIKIELISDNDYVNCLDEITKQEKDYFIKLTNKQKKLKESLHKAKIEAKEKALEKQRAIEAEQKAKAKKEKAEKERVASLSPFELKIEEIVKQYPDQNASKSVIVFQALEKGKLQEFYQEALKLVKRFMIQEDIWDKPKKKSAYKRTLKVIEMLENSGN